MEDSKKIKVVNKSAGVVAYSLPELNNLYRTFNKDESKEVTFGEMRMLSYIPGGEVLIKDYLTIMDKDAVAELIGEVEPEYYYTKKEITEILKYGSLDQLEDCLNFAPQGVLDLVKNTAIEIRLNEVDKRKLISERLQLNLDRAIEFAIDDEAEKGPETKVVRKATAKAEPVEEAPKTTKRKAAAVKIVSNSEGA